MAPTIPSSFHPQNLFKKPRNFECRRIKIDVGKTFSVIVNHDQISNTQLESRNLQTFFDGGKKKQGAKLSIRVARSQSNANMCKHELPKDVANLSHANEAYYVAAVHKTLAFYPLKTLAGLKIKRAINWNKISLATIRPPVAVPPHASRWAHGDRPWLPTWSVVTPKLGETTLYASFANSK